MVDELSHPPVFEPGRKVEDLLIVNYVGRGNSGEVYRATRGDDGREFALKLFVPYYELRQLALGDVDAEVTSTVNAEVGHSLTEYRFLSKISHPFIVDVHANGEASLSREEGDRLRTQLTRKTNPPEYKGKPFLLPYIVTTWIEGQSLDKCIDEITRTNPASVPRMLLSVAQALEYLHRAHRYLHGDVKPQNVMIRSADGFPIVIDFALCKNLNFEDDEVDPDEHVDSLQVDWSLTPDDALPAKHPFKALMREGGSRRQIRDLCLPTLDFYQYGTLLRSLRPRLAPALPPADSRYVESLIEHLTDWERVTTLRSGDLSEMVSRVGGASVYPVPSILRSDPAALAINLLGDNSVVVPGQLAPLTINRSFNRLSLINQLSFLAFDPHHPGASHNRAFHAYDALRVMQEAIAALSGVPAFRSLVGSREVLQLQALALLHDINHVPMLHLFQESEVPGIRSLPLIDMVCEGVTTGEGACGKPSIFKLLEEVDLDPGRFRRIVHGRWDLQEGPVVEFDRLANSLLKSAIDIDKLSYLALDSELSGLGFASGLRSGQLFGAMTVATVELKGKRGPHIAFRSDSLGLVEEAMWCRYAAFSELYWSSANRAMMAVFLDVIRRLFGEGSVDIAEFIRSNIFGSDLAWITAIERMYNDTFNEPAGLLDLIHAPDQRPRALVRSVRLHQQISREDTSARLETERRLTDSLCRRAKVASRHPHMVTIDVPRRDLDLGGAAFIVDRSSAVEPVDKVSSRLRDLERMYEALARSATVFVDPLLSTALLDVAGGDEYRLQLWVEEAVLGEESEVQ